ncbi:MAG: RNA polymerase sigma factor [Acidimicrobiia bacterium]
MAEQDLIGRAKAGDTAAYAALVRSHQAVAFRAAFLITRSAQDAEEATQDGFVKAWKALDRFRDDAPFRPWLMRIVTNEALNRVRSRKRRRARELSVPLDVTAPAAESQALSRAEAETLLAAVDRLPDKYRLTVSYLYLLGFSEAETADALGVAVGTVKSRAARARAMLGDDLGKQR